jgi:hypothetical protein
MNGTIIAATAAARCELVRNGNCPKNRR